jgi:chromosome segregation protein
LRLDAQQAQERRARIELDLVRRQAELKFLDETSRKDLHIPVAEIAGEQEPAPDEIELAALEQKHDEVKARIEALGPVNPQALEEYEEARQRYEFLNAQRQDLLDSIRDTEKAIQEIDAEARRRFSEAFEAINANFREMFKTLFGGGSAEMRLTDETNAGESGVDIVASPPGKRLQNVLLLSGGEKALAALISHAKRTMEAAQALYGVTMQEPGVSRLVSVRFDTGPSPPPPEPAAAPAAVV